MSAIFKLHETYPVGTAVRVTYEWEGESYFFDGEVTYDIPHFSLPPKDDMRIVLYVKDLNTGISNNVYSVDTIEDLESLHTPKES